MKKTTNVKWWDKKWGLHRYCGITQSRLRPGKYKDGINICTFLDCSHGFYTRPLIEWIKTNPSCPYCREYIDLEKFTQKLLNI